MAVSVRIDVSFIEPSKIAAKRKPSDLRLRAMHMVVRMHFSMYVYLPFRLKSAEGRPQLRTSATGIRTE